jgi:hypothetical protein
MPVIDLTRYIVGHAGTWTDPTTDDNLFNFTKADTCSASRLLLRWAGDFVALTGPLVVRVTVQAENLTVPLALVANLIPREGAIQEMMTTSAANNSAAFATLRETTLAEAALGRFKTDALSVQASTIYSYTLDIPAGQAWPFRLSEQLDAIRFRNPRAAYAEHLGNNLGFRVLIEPAFEIGRLRHVVTGADLPCDFAVADQPNVGAFFPVACEPCQGSVMGLPPSGSVTLVTPPAEGGCVRTRFFNGMFITREDLETEQRYLRLKMKLHNRAAGAGVVWGFAVGKHADYVCVQPGYGVDCCGNDLALTTTYKVDIAALLADPAAASHVRHQRGAAPMHLLLEYVECPSDARPVHGDPCLPEANRCEMSRIRESVRLRLVPPRDCTESWPIKRFLEEVNLLRQRYPIGRLFEGDVFERAPFQLYVVATYSSGQPTEVAVRPASTWSADDRAKLQNLNQPQRLSSLKIEIRKDPLWSFVGGTMTASATTTDGKPIGTVVPAAPVSLASATTATYSFADGDSPGQMSFSLAGWQMQTLFAAADEAGPTAELGLTFHLNPDRLIIEVDPTATQIRYAAVNLAAAPCEGDPCAPRKRDGGYTTDPCAPLAAAEFAQPFPWLHADPVHPASAADPKVLMLAAG